MQSCKNSKKDKQNDFSLMNMIDNDIFKDGKTTRRTVLHNRDLTNMSINLDKKDSVD